MLELDWGELHVLASMVEHSVEISEEQGYDPECGFREDEWNVYVEEQRQLARKLRKAQEEIL